MVLGLKLPSEITGIKRATVEDTYAQIEKDLLEAIPDLPKRSEYDAMDLGRATKGAAQGYLAKAYLYQGNIRKQSHYYKRLLAEASSLVAEKNMNC